MQDLLSVIVPIYRTEEYLDRCIESIVCQTYKNLEIILVDDGSEDMCPSICDKWALVDGRIVVIHKKNEGLVVARKTGLLKAQAEYIGYVDSDDWLEPDFYEMLMSKIKEYDCDIVCSGRIEEFAKESHFCKNKIQEGYYKGTRLRDDLIRHMICDEQGELFNLYPTVWDKVFKKEILLGVQMNVPELITIGEDVACTYPAILQAKSVYVLNECKYHYNKIHNNSMLNVKDDRYFTRLHILQDYLAKNFTESLYGEELKRPLDEYIYRQALSGIKHEFGINKYPLSFRDRVMKTYLFPYEMVPPYSDIVLYGAGKIGKQFIKQIRQNCYCNIVKWIDRKNDNINVFGIEVLKNLYFDFVIIAVANEDFVREIRKSLIDIGICDDRIIWKAGYGVVMDDSI